MALEKICSGSPCVRKCLSPSAKALAFSAYFVTLYRMLSLVVLNRSANLGEYILYGSVGAPYSCKNSVILFHIP